MSGKLAGGGMHTAESVSGPGSPVNRRTLPLISAY